jgi:chemotaxis protein CheX
MISAEILGLLNTTEEKIAKHLDEDVREIFSTMVGVNVSPSQAAVTATKFTDCVSAMVGFAGSYNGVLSINTPIKLSKYFASQMLGTEVVELDADVLDALGEIANMVGGSFKHHFVNDGHEVRLSTPSVISGDKYVMSTGSLADVLTLLFETAEGQFMASIYLEAGQ